ncbi:MAG: hypothetical protein D4R73_11115 [Deltaproteobacteria bacterium]|nr:MAG: hypothetical protein D4R73_11115 [Deltaproteobacteria bacterium]
MRSELSKRIAKLEGKGFAAAEIRLAYLNFVDHGIVPPNPRLAKIVNDLVQCLAEMDASVPRAPEVPHEQH